MTAAAARSKAVVSLLFCRPNCVLVFDLAYIFLHVLSSFAMYYFNCNIAFICVSLLVHGATALSSISILLL